MNDPNDLALVLVASLALLGFEWREGRTVRNWILLGIPTASILYGIYLTRSRGGMLGALAVFFVWFVARAGKTKAILLTGTLAAAFIGLNFTGGRSMSTSEESAAGRLNAWSEGIEMFRSSPVFGIGFENFTEHNELTAHNSFVLCFAELGSVGYFFWLALLAVSVLQVKLVFYWRRTHHLSQVFHRYSLSVLASLAGVVVTSFFLSRSYNGILYLLMGIAYAVYTQASRNRCAATLPSAYRIGRGVAGLEVMTIMVIYAIVRVNRLFI